MILRIEQTGKELYEANFRIRRGDTAVGMINVRGNPGRMEADARTEIFEKRYFLSPDGNRRMGIQTKICRGKEEKAHRPYLIDGGDTGGVCQIERKTGMFSTAYFHGMIFKNARITMYAKLLKTGGKHSVYCLDKQIAQIDTSPVITDDMYDYTVYADSQRSAETAVLYCVYMYILTGFKPGQKVIKGIHKQVSVSFDKTFDDKFDPEFAGRIMM